MKKKWSYKLVFMVNACNIFSIVCIFISSQVLEVLPSGSSVGDDTWVVSFKRLGLNKSVLVGWNKLSFVIGASVTDDDLRRILVGHHYRWLGQSASERVGVVRSQGLLQHACVQVVSHLIGLGRETGRLGWSLWGQVNGLGGTVVESKAHSLTVLGQNRVTRGDFGVFEHGSWLCAFIADQFFFHGLSHESLDFSLLFSSGLVSHLLFNWSHWVFYKIITSIQFRE